MTSCLGFDKLANFKRFMYISVSAVYISRSATFQILKKTLKVGCASFGKPARQPAVIKSEPERCLGSLTAHAPALRILFDCVMS